MYKKGRNEIALKIVHLRKEVSDLRLGFSLALSSNDDALGRLLLNGIAQRRIALKALGKMRAS